MSDQANRITAEYLVRKVPLDWQAHEDAADMARENLKFTEVYGLGEIYMPPRSDDGSYAEYVSPIRFIAGWVVVVAIAALIFWGL